MRDLDKEVKIAKLKLGFFEFLEINIGKHTVVIFTRKTWRNNFKENKFG